MPTLNEKAKTWFERQRPLIGYRNDEDDLMFKYVLAALEDKGGAVTEEFVEKWEGRIVSEVIFQINQSNDEVHPGVNIINTIREMLREAGVAGKEEEE